jgi:hypothetical protein
MNVSTNQQKAITMPQSDLELTRAACLEPGVLKQDLQTHYLVVRDGKRVRIPRMELTLQERTVISDALHILAQRAERELADAKRFDELLQPLWDKHGRTLTIGQVLEREGLTLAQGWALAQARGPKQ